MGVVGGMRLNNMIYNLLLAVCLCSLISSCNCTRLEEKDVTTFFSPRSPIRSLPNDVPIVDPPKRVAGYFRLNRTEDARLFYFLFESRKSPSTDPLVLWMTGGPGCSSELAIFFENGPYTLDSTTKTSLLETKFGWDIGHNLLYVDQPVNVGFSYSNDPRDEVTSEKLVADDMLDFLQEFMDAHPEYKNRPFFVTGESYGGHYVPAVSNRLWRAKQDGEGEPINLQGLAIGNGMTNPGIQYGSYADYAKEHGLISKGVQKRMNKQYPRCKKACDKCDKLKTAGACALASTICDFTQWRPLHTDQSGVNVYDVRKKCEAELCYKEFGYLQTYLNTDSVQQALGVVNRTWVTCNYTVYGDFSTDFMQNCQHYLIPLLEDGLRVLIYVGDQDLICNWVGNWRWVSALPWSGKANFSKADNQDWTVGNVDAPAGWYRTAGPLTFLKVFQAGHMVPMDQPEAALDLITRFTGNKGFGPAPSPSGGGLSQQVSLASKGSTTEPNRTTPSYWNHVVQPLVERLERVKNWATRALVS